MPQRLMFPIHSTVPVNRATRELSDCMDLAQVLRAIQLSSVSQINFTHFFIAFEPQRTLSLHNLLNKHWNICSSISNEEYEPINFFSPGKILHKFLLLFSFMPSFGHSEGKPVRDRCAALQITARIAVFPQITRRNTVRSTVVKGKKREKRAAHLASFLVLAYNFTHLILF